MTASIAKRITRRRTACVAAGVLGIALMSAVSVTAEDALLPQQQGEIVFEAPAPPKIDEFELDPEIVKRLSDASKNKLEREAALRRVTGEMATSKNRQKDLSETVTALNRDREILVDQLITTAKSIQGLEDDLADTEKRIAALAADERQIKLSLADRRAILAEVLAALQRMGQNPPPALFVSAADALNSVRSAIMLGAVLPELRGQAAALIDDLQTLADLQTAAKAQQSQLASQQQRLTEEQVRLDLLIKENQSLKAQSDRDFLKETQKVNALSETATNLRELITALSDEIAKANRDKSAAEQKAEAEAERILEAYHENREQELAEIAALTPATNGGATLYTDAATLPYQQQNDAADTAAAIDTIVLSSPQKTRLDAPPFAETKGLLPLPARGVQLRSFGDEDGIGGSAEGITLATRGQAQVIAPATGQVLFAGPFRSFRHLLILDVGDDHHILMAGMDRIDVAIGDIVRAGEPVAVMGAGKTTQNAGQTTTSGDFFSSQTQPLLYVEFRKKSKSIDPTPWWAS